MPVPVFAAVGAGAWGPVQELRGRPEVRLVASPRHASVLLVAGAIAGEHGEALDRVHDQIPHPRAVVAWTGATEHPLTATVVRGGADELVAMLQEAHRSVLADPASSSPDRLPDEEPNEWRGVGPFGQGGEGMMGGTPYGRPMAMTGDDRDGLALDQLHLPLGPFLEWLPPGVVLDVTLQGEVLQAVTPRLASPGGEIGSPPAPGNAPASAAHQSLRLLALALHLHGLDALAARAARLPAAGDDDAARAFRRLEGAVRRSGHAVDAARRRSRSRGSATPPTGGDGASTASPPRSTATGRPTIRRRSSPGTASPQRSRA